MTPQDLLAAGYRMGLRMVHMMCDDLTAEEFHHQPVEGANSAAWIVGHLAVVARWSAERLGATDLPALSDGFRARYAATKSPAAIQTAHGGKEELLGLLDQCIGKLIEEVKKLPDSSLERPPAFTGPFATNSAEGILFGSLHIMLHSGQLSTIRRSLGKPPLV
ncbi:MAG TPA: DinB family protein [Gemmata sp.]|nr:DinB family protein [Gemmata sp.]